MTVASSTGRLQPPAIDVAAATARETSDAFICASFPRRTAGQRIGFSGQQQR
jgi:hypothetical protein